MVKVLSPGQSHARSIAWLSVCLALIISFGLLAPRRLLAQQPAKSKPGAPAKQTGSGGGQAAEKAKGEADAAKGEEGDDQPQSNDQKKAED